MIYKVINRLVHSVFYLVLFAPFGAVNAYSTFLTETTNNNWSQPQNFAEVVIQELTGGDIQFTISLCGDPASSACGPDPQGNLQNIEIFGFNITGNPDSVDLLPGDFILPSIDWTVDIAPPVTNLNGFGGFDVGVKWSGQGAAGLDPLTFIISKAGDSIASYATDLTNRGALYAVKIASTGPGAFIGGGTVVPVPAALILFGSGLLGLIGIARSKKVA
jgi:hypothetical protein